MQALETSPEEHQVEQAPETSPDEQQNEPDNLSSDYEGSFLSGFSDIDSFSENEVIKTYFSIL